MKILSGLKGPRLLLITLITLIIGFALLMRYSYSVESFGDEQSLDAVYRFADKGQILWSKLLDEDAQVIGRVCAVPTVGQPRSDPRQPSTKRCPGRVTDFHASYPRSDVSTQVLIERLAEQAPVVVEKQTVKAVGKVLATFLFPLLILANLFGVIFLSRGGETSISEIVGFGKMGRRRGGKGSAPGVTFADVAGAQEAVAELREVTDYLADPVKFQQYDASPPRGVLLFGPPGCGKTLLARAVAGESGVPFISISGAEFVESLVGVGAARVRDLFRQVRDVAPAIVFIDEIDAVGRSREGEGGSGGEREQTVNQLLVEMDGFETTAGIVVMAATNRPDILDPALLRPGRFDRHVILDPPDLHGRQAILELHAQGKPFDVDVDFEAVARATPGFTGADLANVVNEGALVAIREGAGGDIAPHHMTEAIQRVLHGPQRRGKLMGAGERKRIAYHEAGHALVAAGVGQADQVQRVSVVARGRGLGQSIIATESERVLLTRTEMESQLKVIMGGMAAEELCFGEPSTAGEHDVDRANDLARQMVGRYGMSEQLGRLRVLGKSEGFLGGGPTLEMVSGQSIADLDGEVKRLVEVAERAAHDLLSRHRTQLDAAAQRLEQDETLEGSTLERLLAPVRPELNRAMAGPVDERRANGAAKAPSRSRRPAGT